LFIEERRLLAIFVIFVLCALKGQGEMAAAHLCLNRKLVYGQIIRKIGFQAFNFAADDGRHSRSTVRVILKDVFCGTLRFAPLRPRRAATVRNTPEMTARIGLKRSRLPLRPFCLSATPAKYLPNFLEVTTDPDKMTYDWESEDSLLCLISA
jgi:hypothetical protein